MIQRFSGAAVAMAVACLWGCGSMTPAMPNPITEPVIDEPGRHLVRYRDAVVEVLIDSTFAADNVGSDWLVLNVGLSGMTASATAIDRTRVSVLTPDRRAIPLPSYRDFNVAFEDLVSTERRATLASRPLDFLRGGRRACAIGFMPRPGSGVASTSTLHVTSRQLCVGLLYFPVPGGVMPGRWRLEIGFEEGEARVPFTLAAE